LRFDEEQEEVDSFDEEIDEELEDEVDFDEEKI